MRKFLNQIQLAWIYRVLKKKSFFGNKTQNDIYPMLFFYGCKSMMVLIYALGVLKLIIPLMPYSGITSPNTSVRVDIPEKHLDVFINNTIKSSSFIVKVEDEHEPSISLTTITP